MLQDADSLVAEAKLRIAASQRVRGKSLDGEAVSSGRVEYAGDDRAAHLPEVEARAGGQQMLTRALLQIVPQAEGFTAEGDVIGVLVIGGADDAGLAVRTAERVAAVELFEAQHPQAPAGECPGRRGAHAPQA